MFHLYFGAFDVLLYLGGMYGALVLAKAICDQMDAADVAQSTTSETSMAPLQPIAPHLITSATKREDISVRVSVN